MQRRITTLEQQHVVDLHDQLDERTQGLDAARAADRELTRHLNHVRGSPFGDCLALLLERLLLRLDLLHQHQGCGRLSKSIEYGEP